jgi:4-amino-4-deoxy-L-arabinose transferase-like glycosyltransferase
MLLSVRQAWVLLLTCLFIFIIWRLWAYDLAQIDLFFDEAYYWGWAQQLDWGYYSKPPMVAWIIYASTQLLGDSIFALHLGATLLYPLSAIVIFLLGLQLFSAHDQRTFIALAGAVVFVSLPLVGFGSWFITTDVPLMFFWAMSLYCYALAIVTNRWKHWLALGICIGLGMMSKYSMVFFAPCALVHLLLSRQLIHQLANVKLYVCLVVALLIFSPNLYWNYQNDFSSFRHTAEISQLDKSLINPQHLLEFFIAQFGLFGFVLFGGLIIAARNYSVLNANPALRLLACFSFVPLLLFCGLALTSRAFANWAAFSYVAAALLIAAYWCAPSKQKWIAGGVGINIVLLALLSHWQILAPVLSVELSKKTDPYFRVKGWAQMAESIAPEFQRYPNARLVGEARDLLAEMSFYLGRQQGNFQYANARFPLIYNPTGFISNHYALTADIKNAPFGQFIWVSSRDLSAEVRTKFSSAEFLGIRVVPVYPGVERRVYIWLLTDYVAAEREVALVQEANKRD